MLVTVIIIHNKYIYIVELIPCMHSRPVWIKNVRQMHKIHANEKLIHGSV